MKLISNRKKKTFPSPHPLILKFLPKEAVWVDFEQKYFPCRKYLTELRAAAGGSSAVARNARQLGVTNDCYIYLVVLFLLLPPVSL